MPRIDRTLLHLASQDTARTNAAEASAELRKRRHEQEDVDAYLGALHQTNPPPRRPPPPWVRRSEHTAYLLVGDDL